MSWTEIFPVLTEELVAQWEQSDQSASSNANGFIGECVKILNSRTCGHVVSVSVCRQDARKREQREALRRCAETVRPFNGVCLRVYLDEDFNDTAEELVSLDCEVLLMKRETNEVSGSLWRLLAFESASEDCLVTISDYKRGKDICHDIDRTAALWSSDLAFWRVPLFKDRAVTGDVSYRPIAAGQWGGKCPLDMMKLINALIWSMAEHKLQSACDHPAFGILPIQNTDWPSSAFEEWFLLTAVYPRIAIKGVLSYVESTAVSSLLPVDIEYVTWANPLSSLTYFGKISLPSTKKTINENDVIEPIVDSIKRVEDFAVVPTDGLTHSHDLPGYAHRWDPESSQVNGRVLFWLNPASIAWKGKRWLAYRTECHPMWQWGRISIAQVDDNYNAIVQSNHIADLPTSFDCWGAEDPRFFLLMGRLFMSYTDSWCMGLAEIGENGEVIHASLFPEDGPRKFPFSQVQREKNWGFFECQSELFVSVSASPHIVYKCDLENWRLGDRWMTPWIAPDSVLGELHGGSTPILHDSLYWRVVHSSRSLDGGFTRCYYLWLMAFDHSPPFQVKFISSVPLVVGEKEVVPLLPEQVKHRVVFCGSLERVHNGWRILFGHNDRRMRVGTILDDELADCLCSVGSE